MALASLPRQRGEDFVRRRLWAVGFALLGLFAPEVPAVEHTLHRFKRVALTDVYYSEGANFGDLNRDGKGDAVCGPYWYEGPEFKTKHEIYKPVPQPTQGYANNFFSWVYDFNGDGWNDVFAVGFPGTAAFVYENPAKTDAADHWKKHEVFDWVSNESPQFTNLVGDAVPELICTRNGQFGYAVFEPKNGLSKWTFHALSERIAPDRFGHGLGVGDVNNDGRLDVIMKDGWLEQPPSLASDPLWTLHPARFAGPGGADMYAYDVDGDGDNDIITSLAAHEFGLAWFEQAPGDKGPTFKQHLIMGDRPEQNRYGLVFSEPHAVALVDMDGDGLKDIVTGKTYWSHHKQSPMWDAGAVVYWFKLVRGKTGVDWLPYLADGEAGIGRGLAVGDINGDALPDIVVGGMKGAHVLLHEAAQVDAETWRKAQPQPFAGYNPAARVEAAHKVSGAIEGEAMKVVTVSAGRANSQKMSQFKAGKWSGDDQLFWIGAKPGDRLELELPVAKDGDYDVEVVLTKARDYAIVQLTLDGKPLGQPIDLYHSNVVTSGVLSFKQSLGAGNRPLAFEIVGANPAAVKAYMVGIDYIRLRPAKPGTVAP